jgi:hypothetical protein
VSDNTGSVPTEFHCDKCGSDFHLEPADSTCQIVNRCTACLRAEFFAAISGARGASMTFVLPASGVEFSGDALKTESQCNGWVLSPKDDA